MNGGISFGQPWSSPYPQSFPQPVPIIAPFWAGFDLTCGASDVLYRQTTSNSTRATVASEIQSHLSLQNAFEPSLVVIATWNDTSHHGTEDYSCGNKVNVGKEFTKMDCFNSVYGYMYTGTCIHDTVRYLLTFAAPCTTFNVYLAQFEIMK